MANMDYETEVKTYLFCKHHKQDKAGQGETLRQATKDEHERDNCCVSASGVEYSGASSRTWSCEGSPVQALETIEYQPV